jgi:hypothetical protein
MDLARGRIFDMRRHFAKDACLLVVLGVSCMGSVSSSSSVISSCSLCVSKPSKCLTTRKDDRLITVHVAEECEVLEALSLILRQRLRLLALFLWRCSCRCGIQLVRFPPPPHCFRTIDGMTSSCEKKLMNLRFA